MDKYVFEIGMSVWVAADAIDEQMQKIVESEGADSFNEERRRILDPFIVGYAMGLATGSLKFNDVHVDETVTKATIARLHERLEKTFPGIQIVKHYKDETQRMSAGLLFGLTEPGPDETYSALKLAFSVTNPYELGPGVQLTQYAETLGINFMEQAILFAAGREIEEMR